MSNILNTQPSQNENVTHPNFECIGESFYLVRTQAGFRQAFKHWSGANIRRTDRVVGFPKSYPSIVSFSNGYAGYSYVCANCLHVNVFKGILNKE